MKLAIISIIAVIYGIIISIPNIYNQPVLAVVSSSHHDGGGKPDGSGGSTKECKSCASISKSTTSSSNDNNDNQVIRANEIPGSSKVTTKIGKSTFKGLITLNKNFGNFNTDTGTEGNVPNNGGGTDGAKDPGGVGSTQPINELGNNDPNYNPNNPFGASSGTQDTNSPFTTQSANTISSRDELLDKVSTPEELQTILAKFRSFIDDTSVSSVINSSLGKVSTVPTSSYGVSYLWQPANIIMKEKYSILMLKFTDAAGNIIKNNNIDYDILIKGPTTNNSVFQKHGSTATGVDLKIIDENSFPIGGSPFNPVNYNVEINVNTVGGNIVSEHASLPKVAVISYNP